MAETQRDAEAADMDDLSYGADLSHDAWGLYDLASADPAEIVLRIVPMTIEG